MSPPTVVVLACTTTIRVRARMIHTQYAYIGSYTQYTTYIHDVRLVRL